MHCTELSCLFSFLWVEIFSVFPCLSQPWLFWRVLARHFAEYLSIWVCLRQRWLNMFPGRSGGTARNRTGWRRISRNVLLGKDPQRVTLAQSHREALQTVLGNTSELSRRGSKLQNIYPLQPAGSFSTSSSCTQAERGGSCSQRAHALAVDWWVQKTVKGSEGINFGALTVYATKGLTYPESHSL